MLEFHEKVLQLYKQRYPHLAESMRLYMHADDRTLIIARQPDYSLSQAEKKKRKDAFSTLDVMREYLERFNTSRALTCALFAQAATCLQDEH